MQRTSTTYVHSNEFGASASNPLASIELVLQATSRPSGVKVTPHLWRKLTPSSSTLKRSSWRTNARGIVGRYLHGRNDAHAHSVLVGTNKNGIHGKGRDGQAKSGRLTRMLFHTTYAHTAGRARTYNILVLYSHRFRTVHSRFDHPSQRLHTHRL